MLTSMRRLSTGFFSKIILLFLIVAFGVWGIGDILRSSGPSYAAKVGSDSITVAEFQQRKALLSRQFEAMGMQGIPAQQLDMSVLRQLIQERLTLLAMRDMGLYVNDALLAKSLRNIPELKNKDGSFNKALFEANLRNQQVNEAMFLSQLKKETAGRFLTDSLSMDDATPPASVMALDAVTSGETRDAVLITVPARGTEAIGEDAIKDYYEKNKAVSYLAPETRTLEYVTLTPADINALVEKSITPEMVKDATATTPKQSKSEIMKQLAAEQRDGMMRNLSNTVEDELAAGKPIGEAFSKAGLNATPHTLADVQADLAKTSTDDVVKTVAEQGFTLSEGEISGLISTPKGTSLMVAVKAVKPAQPRPFDAVKADVKKQLAANQAKDGARTKALELKAALAKEPNWQAATAKFNVSTRAVSNLARPVDGKPTGSGIPASIQQSIFEHPQGDVAGPLTLENGDQMLALVLQAHHPKITDAKLSKAAMSDQTAKLSQDIQNRTFNALATQHPVKVNPQLMARDSQP